MNRKLLCSCLSLGFLSLAVHAEDEEAPLHSPGLNEQVQAVEIFQQTKKDPKLVEAAAQQKQLDEKLANEQKQHSEDEKKREKDIEARLEKSMKIQVKFDLENLKKVKSIPNDEKRDEALAEFFNDTSTTTWDARGIYERNPSTENLFFALDVYLDIATHLKNNPPDSTKSIATLQIYTDTKEVALSGPMTLKEVLAGANDLITMHLDSGANAKGIADRLARLRALEK